VALTGEPDQYREDVAIVVIWRAILFGFFSVCTRRKV